MHHLYFDFVIHSSLISSYPHTSAFLTLLQNDGGKKEKGNWIATSYSIARVISKWGQKGYLLVRAVSYQIERKGPQFYFAISKGQPPVKKNVFFRALPLTFFCTISSVFSDVCFELPEASPVSYSEHNYLSAQTKLSPLSQLIWAHNETFPKSADLPFPLKLFAFWVPN